MDYWGGREYVRPLRRLLQFIKFLKKKTNVNVAQTTLSPINSHQFSSITQSCPTLGDLMDCRTPGFPVHHYLPELAQAHVHGVGDASQPSCPLSPPSP